MTVESYVDDAVDHREQALIDLVIEKATLRHPERAGLPLVRWTGAALRVATRDPTLAPFHPATRVVELLATGGAKARSA